MPERMVSIPLPPPRPGTGGVSLLETFLLIAASRIVNARRIFEFGTYLGRTTLDLASNSSADTRIWTLDLDERYAGQARQSSGDAALTQVHLAARALDFEGTPAEKKISRLTGDSTTFDFAPWKDSMDLVFIDGGHDLATLQSDTDSALDMARSDAPACIAWHDYGNPECPEVAPYLETLAARLDLFHVCDSKLIFWFNAPARCNLAL